MKAKIKTTFERHGEYVVGHVEDAEMYEKVKKGTMKWEATVYPRITHIRIPKEVFERLLELDKQRGRKNEQQQKIYKKIFEARAARIKKTKGVP